MPNWAAPWLRVPGGGGGSAPAIGVFETLDPNNTFSSLSLSNGNLTATANSSVGAGANSLGMGSQSAGQYYCEFRFSHISGSQADGVGIANTTQPASLGRWLGEFASSIGLYSNGNYLTSSGATSLGIPFTISNVVCMAVDLGNSAIWWRVDGGNWNGSAGANPATNTGGVSISSMTGSPCSPGIELEDISDSCTVNFGASAYAQTPPSGFMNWPI